MASSEKIIKNVFFDLDGTLIDSSYDIKRILLKSLNICGYTGNGITNRIKIGPPLEEMVKTAVPGIEDGQIKKVVTLYRQDYKSDDLKMTIPYQGITELIETLNNKGINVFIATYKPKNMSVRILERHFSGLYKDIATPTEIVNFSEGKTKTDILNFLLSKWGINAGETIMIGDSGSDINCAKEAGMRAIAVLYGFGAREEFINADDKAETVEDLRLKIKNLIK